MGSIPIRLIFAFFFLPPPTPNKIPLIGLLFYHLSFLGVSFESAAAEYIDIILITYIHIHIQPHHMEARLQECHPKDSEWYW
jgi:hypothetical protein